MSRLVAEHRFPTGHCLSLIHGDLTEQAVDAIVNAANPRLMHGGGVAAAIARRGGPSIQAESDAWVLQHGPVGHDSPAITGGGRLPCRHVIHAVGPVWGEGDEDAKLSAALSGALALAESRNLASLALPAISTGIFGFPKDRAARVTMEALAGYLDRHPDTPVRDIRLVLIEHVSLRLFAEEFERRWPGSLAPA